MPDPAGACSFNRTSGAQVAEGTTVTVAAYGSSGYDFCGWYLGDALLSSTASFSYTMPTEDITLVARYNYNPSSPADPSSTQTDIDNTPYVTGDANGDGDVDINDMVAIVNYILGKDTTAKVVRSDTNADGDIDINDMVSLVNLILGK